MKADRLLVNAPRCLIEKATQLNADYPIARAIGGLYGVNYAREKGSYKTGPLSLPKAGWKEKLAVLDEFIKTTGHKNWKYALRVLNKPETAEALPVVRQSGQTQAAPKKPANRAGKKIYTDAVVASLRLIWAFFWHKCGKLLAPLPRQQTDYIAQWPAFGITPDIREKPLKISPAAIDRALKKDRAALALKGKSLAKPGRLLKHRAPISAFYTSDERKLPGFIQIDTARH
jgi:hypothetical protein